MKTELRKNPPIAWTTEKDFLHGRDHFTKAKRFLADLAIQAGWIVLFMLCGAAFNLFFFLVWEATR